MDSAMLAIAEKVKSNNDARVADARAFTGFIYFFIALTMLVYSFTAAVLSGWLVRLKPIPKSENVIWNTAYHFLIIGVVYFGVSLGAGVVGMLVLTVIVFLYLLVMIILAICQRDEICVEEAPQPDRENKRNGAAADAGVEEDAVNALGPQSSGAKKAEEDLSVESVTTTDLEDSLPPKKSDTEVFDEEQKEREKKAARPDDRRISVPHTKAMTASLGMGYVVSYQHPTNFPLAVSIRQWKWFVLACLLLFALLLLMVLMGFLYSPKPYKIISPTGAAEEEFQPQLTATALVVMYSFPGMATSMGMKMPVEAFTKACGTRFREELASAADRRSEIHEPWIERYNINMTEYVRPLYIDYTSVNEWFTRPIRMELRPVAASANAIGSPADSRLLIFSNADASKIWVKGSLESAASLTGGVAGDYWNQGVFIISRLAPQDYHRFHAPVSGTVESVTEVDGTYWSVFSEAVRSENDALLNKRKVVVIATPLGRVAYVAVGATCVGSVLIQNGAGTAITAGYNVTRGEQLGIMQFGGSTILVFFPPGVGSFDATIMERSRMPVETRVLTNQQIGTL